MLYIVTKLPMRSFGLTFLVYAPFKSINFWQFIAYTISIHFIELFKILKFREPRGLFEYLAITVTTVNRMVLNPNIKNNKLPVTEQNLLFKSCKIWITFAQDIFEKNKININLGYIIPGEEANSYLSASVTIIKYRVTKFFWIDSLVALRQTKPGWKVSFKYNKLSQYNWGR